MLNLKDFRTLLTLALPLLMSIEIEMGGRLLLAELVLGLALVLFPFIYNIRFSNHLKVALVLAGLWLAGAILTDTIRATAFEDWIRTWAKVVTFSADLVACWFLVNGDRNRGILLVWAIFVGTALRVFTGVVENVEGESFDVYWKFGYGSGFSATVLIIVGWLNIYRFPRWLNWGSMFFVPALNLLLAARSLFAQTAISVALTAFREARRRSISTQQLAFILLAGFAVIWSISSIYSYSAANGILGDDARTKYNQQAGNEGGVLLGGRSEILASSQAVMDSPIIGHGSWARDSYYVRLLRYRAAKLGMPVPQDAALLTEQIPTHSVLMGSWVESGILGSVIWFWAIWMGLKAMVIVIRRGDPFLALILTVLASYFWDILFSPLGLDRRLAVAATMVLIFILIDDGPVMKEKVAK